MIPHTMLGVARPLVPRLIMLRRKVVKAKPERPRGTWNCQDLIHRPRLSQFAGVRGTYWISEFASGWFVETRLEGTSERAEPRGRCVGIGIRVDVGEGVSAICW